MHLARKFNLRKHPFRYVCASTSYRKSLLPRLSATFWFVPVESSGGKFIENRFARLSLYRFKKGCYVTFSKANTLSAQADGW
jgi:hypothetical protein